MITFVYVPGPLYGVVFIFRKLAPPVFGPMLKASALPKFAPTVPSPSLSHDPELMVIATGLTSFALPLAAAATRGAPCEHPVAISAAIVAGRARAAAHLLNENSAISSSSV